MKYFYIGCLILSSLFTYKHSLAKDHLLELAFFVPKGAFQQNTAVKDIELMRPRQAETPTESSSSKTSQDTPVQTPSAASDNTSQPLKISRPYVKKKVTPQKKIIITDTQTAQEPLLTTAEPEKKTPDTPTVVQADAPVSTEPEITAEIQQKLNKYSLDDPAPLPSTSTTNTLRPQTPDMEKITPQNLAEMLEKIPLPNFDLPKFKQLYSTYGMELRILHRRGKLPYNSEQEDTLAKANTLERFEVK